MNPTQSFIAPPSSFDWVPIVLVCVVVVVLFVVLLLDQEWPKRIAAWLEDDPHPTPKEQRLINHEAARRAREGDALRRLHLQALEREAGIFRAVKSGNVVTFPKQITH